MTDWSYDFSLEFLKLYKSEPLLWDQSHSLHKDKKRVKDAWLRLSVSLERPVPELKKKKDSLMATYRGHSRRKIASIKSGASADEVYKPVWFAYEYMESFLGQVYEPVASTNMHDKQVCDDWDQDESLALINRYKDYEILWNTRLKKYHNKSKKEEAWMDLAESLGKNCEEVKKKMERLKGSYRREEARMRNSGSAYKSNWFAYKSLQFLKNKDLDDLPETSSELDVKCEEELNIKCERDIKCEPDPVEDSYISPVEENDEDTEPNPTESSKNGVPSKVRRVATKRSRPSQEKTHRRLHKLTAVEDECDLIGKHVAVQLRQLPLPEMLQANVEIQQVLMKYRLKSVHQGYKIRPSTGESSSSEHSVEGDPDHTGSVGQEQRDAS